MSVDLAYLPRLLAALVARDERIGHGCRPGDQRQAHERFGTGQHTQAAFRDT